MYCVHRWFYFVMCKSEIVADATTAYTRLITWPHMKNAASSMHVQSFVHLLWCLRGSFYLRPLYFWIARLFIEVWIELCVLTIIKRRVLSKLFIVIDTSIIVLRIWFKSWMFDWRIWYLIGEWWYMVISTAFILYTK